MVGVLVPFLRASLEDELLQVLVGKEFPQVGRTLTVVDLHSLLEPHSLHCCSSLCLRSLVADADCSSDDLVHYAPATDGGVAAAAAA